MIDADQQNPNHVLTKSIASVFFSFSVPVVIGLLAVSSAVIVDGMFVGRYAGETALAAITLSVPVFPIAFGLVILFSTGGEVYCGKFIGERNYLQASDVFTKVTLIIFSLSIVCTALGLFFINPIALTLGANHETQEMVVDYLQIIFWFVPVFAMYSLSYFVRVDGKPKLSSFTLVLVAILNIVLDYIFIVRWQWGVKGAAWGTSLSHVVLPVLLLPHFLFRKGKIWFTKPSRTWGILIKIAYNGSSEFLSEISGGILFYLINISMMKYYGTSGVAAYAIVGYLIFFISTSYYGVSDALKSILSIHFGAREFLRIKQFLQLAIFSVVLFGFLLVLLTQMESLVFVKLFVKTETQVSMLANRFILWMSPAFVMIGVNIILASYLTAMHLPLSSLVVAFSRALVFPVILIPVIAHFMAGDGVIVALVLSETITLFIALVLFSFTKRKVFHSSLHN